MPEARLGYLILCDAHGKVGGKDCIYGVFNRIFVANFPAVHELCSLAFEIWAEPGTHKLGLRVMNTDGEDIFPPMEGQDLPVSAAGQGTGAIQLRNLQLQKAGIYSFVITIDGEQVGARDLMVEPLPNRAPPPQG
jgi:uncharacterized protein DUF6941